MTNAEMQSFIEQKALEQKRKTRKILFIVVGCFIGFGLLVFTIVMSVMLSSDAYKVATEEISRSKEVEEATGGIEDIGWPAGNISTINDSGEANLDISVDGKTKDVDVFVQLQKLPGSQWEVVSLEIY